MMTFWAELALQPRQSHALVSTGLFKKVIPFSKRRSLSQPAFYCCVTVKIRCANTPITRWIFFRTITLCNQVFECHICVTVRTRSKYHPKSFMFIYFSRRLACFITVIINILAQQELVLSSYHLSRPIVERP
jgi:hypothetical protein